MDTLRVVLLLAAAAIVLLWVFVSPSAVLIQSAPQLRQLAPKGTPIEIIEKLNKEISTVVTDPNVSHALLD